MPPDKETSLGGARKGFPSTRWSMILETRDRASLASRAALEELCRLYWRPVYCHVRTDHSVGNEEAKDLTQEFFLEVIEGKQRILDRYLPERGTFRGYLVGALRLFLLEHRRKERAMKRGGGEKIFRLDEKFDEAEGIPETLGGPPEEAFDREWACSVIRLAAEDLREELVGEDKEVYFRLFDRYVLNPPVAESLTYARLAQEFGLPEKEISKILVHCRVEIRRRMAERIRDYVGTDNEVGSELSVILGLLRT